MEFNPVNANRDRSQPIEPLAQRPLQGQPTEDAISGTTGMIPIEAALQERGVQLSSIFQTVPSGIIILAPTGQIIAANSAAEQILKLTRSDITARGYNDPTWAITTIDGKPLPDEELPFSQVMRTGKPIYESEHTITRADGTKIILSVNASPSLDVNGNITNVIAVISDITERKQIEMRLRESEERYRLVIETAAEGIVFQQADGTIFTCNASAERILGLTADQIMGRTSLDPNWCAIYEDGSPFPGELHPSMVTLRTGEPQSNVTMGIRKPDQTLTWISINTRPLFRSNTTTPSAVVASFFDITDHKQAETERVELLRQQIQEQTARLAAEADLRRSAFLVEVSTALAKSLDYEQTLQRVAQLAVPYFADWCAVDLLQEDGTIVRVAVAHSEPEKERLGWELAQSFPRHLADGYGISEVMRTGQSEIAIAITDEQLAEIPNAEYLNILRGLGLKSFVVAPLQARGRVLGSISFIFAESNRHYDKNDLELAEDLARRAAIAIDNARLYYSAQQAQQAAEIAADRTARLQRVTAALSESLTPEQVVDVIVEQSMSVLKAAAALVVLVNPEQTEVEIVKSVGYTEDLVDAWQKFSIDTDVPLAQAIRTGEPVWIENFLDRIARYPHLAGVYNRYGFQSWLSLPLVVEGRSIGGLLLSFNEFRHLNQDDREFILALTRQCAQAISRAQLYEAEQTARAEAEQANRIKDEFLAVLSHELRSPLNPILGWTKLLRTQRVQPEKIDLALETIERNAKLQAQLIEDLLDISRMLRGKLSLNSAPVDLKAVIQGALETVQLAASTKSIQVQTTLQPIAGTVTGDANRLQQVLWNLLSNAIKFTSEEGRVEVRLEPVIESRPSDMNQTAPSPIAHGPLPLPHQVQITVTDTGKGIHPDFLPHVFEYFRQADSSITRRFGGLGLGLAIARQIVELHGGTIQADSPGEGQGAIFTVRLPLQINSTDHRKGEAHRRSPNAPSDATLAGIQVLVVDDEPDMRDLTEFVLLQHGAEVTVASSAAEAIAALSQRVPDVLLCDIGMPEMDGYALMQQIRDRSQAAGGMIKAIALTAYAGEYDRRQALAAGFHRHITKPVEPDELVKAIDQLVNQEP
ncbi:GAF domain-containing protein [Egbenema bharatensis]|uniref:GAF domain-containing protein n=1 Tax=Egbenema bharatensis TaxID=3463334 RepID=UPI003A86B532